MLSVFLELVKKVGIFVIVGQTIQHFGISKKYEQYVKLVISIMVVSQIVFSFGIYVKKLQKQGVFVSGSEYLEEWENNMGKVEEKMKDYNSFISEKMGEDVLRMEEQEAVGEKVKEDTYGIVIEKITLP